MVLTMKLPTYPICFHYIMYLIPRLRTPETVWFWRPVAQLVGAIFFARWILELNAYIDEHDIRFLSWRSSKHEVVADQEECATTEESKLLMTER